MYKNRNLIAMFLLIMIFAGTGQSFAATDRKVLSVPEYTQQPNDSICWAVRAAMIISYFKGDSTNRGVEIAKHKHGKTFNQSGSIDDTEYYVKKYTDKSGTIKNSSLFYRTVKSQIEDNGPIGVSIEWKSGGGHAMVIKGYDESDDSVLYNDPWDGRGHAASYSYFEDNKQWEWTKSLYYK